MSDELSKYQQREIERDAIIQKEYEARVTKWDSEEVHQERLCQVAEKDCKNILLHREKDALRADYHLSLCKEHHQDWKKINGSLLESNQKQAEHWGRIADALEKIASKQ